MSEERKYLVIGAGGVGANVAGFLAKAGKSVSLIARGQNLSMIQSEGLLLKSDLLGETRIKSIVSVAEEDYKDSPDVIFLCVKSYGLTSIIPLLKRVATEDTLIIPLLNGFRVGQAFQKKLTKGVVLEGCIYILGTLLEPGVVRQQNSIFRIVFGFSENVSQQYITELEAIRQDLVDSGIKATLSDDIERDTFMKWAFISATALVGAYFDVPMGEIQKEGEPRSCFISLLQECETLAQAMAINLNKGLVETNLQVLDKTAIDATSSLQKDLKKGKNSEIEELLFKMIILGDQYNVSMATYKNLSQKFK